MYQIKGATVSNSDSLYSETSSPHPDESINFSNYHEPRSYVLAQIHDMQPPAAGTAVSVTCEGSKPGFRSHAMHAQEETVQTVTSVFEGDVLQLLYDVEVRLAPSVPHPLDHEVGCALAAHKLVLLR